MSSQLEFLSPFDASFLELEGAPGVVAHMGAVFVLESEPDWTGVMEQVTSLVTYIPRLRARALRVPLRGYAWVEDPGFRPEKHIRRVDLPEGSDASAVLEAAGKVFSRPLDLSRPLWDLHWYCGLEDGRSAMFFRFHHAVTDMLGIIGAVLSPPVTDLPEPPASEPDLSLGLGLRSQASVVADRVAWIGRTIAQTATDSGFRRSARDQVTAHTNHLRTIATSPANHRSDSLERRLATVRFPLEAFRAAAKQRGVRLNDLYVAASLEATRRCLVEADALPRRLRATMPINLRAEGDTSPDNAVARGLVEVETAGGDLLGRLNEVSRAVEHAGNLDSIPVGPLVRDLQALLPGPLRRPIHERIMTFPDTLASNLPVPCPSVVFASRKIVEGYPIAPGITVPMAFSAATYDEHLHIGVTVHAGLLPDVTGAEKHFEAVFSGLVPDSDFSGAATRQNLEAE